MDYKEKFEDFLTRMKGLLDDANKKGHILVRIEDLENTFPELKESKDEKIRKHIISVLEDYWQTCKNIDYDSSRIQEDIAWLEKQDKSTTIDVDAMVFKYTITREDCTNSLPINCQIRAYRQGINDALKLSLGMKKWKEIDKGILSGTKDGTKEQI